MKGHADELVEVAANACRRAGAYLLDSFSEPSRLSTKNGRFDLVTRCDSAAEQMIRRDLTDVFPDSVVIGEEDGTSGDGELAWYVDPIDGTHNFARGIALFCVSIGILRRGVPVGGCVYDPVRDELFSAGTDGLLLNGAPLPGPPDHEVTEQAGERLPMLLTDIPTAGAADGVELDLFHRLLDIADVRRIGSSALALAYVAAGRADVAANADVYPWDTAAGGVLVTAAGGRFTEFPAPRPGAPGGFAAWLPSCEALGRLLERELGGLPALNG
ncbi:inositol monophosphatase [Streptosporangium sp. NPDC051023]|uniref:inositol monophosphatase family protein n=1 Tax=Streptosporangium sp. NPDC051023 TaxID=3155410 RepID=UPI00344B5D31